MVSEGLVPALINRIKERSFVYIYFALLSLMTTQKGVIEEMEDLGFVDDMCSILRNTSCSVTEENGVSIVLLRMINTRHLRSLQRKDHNVQWQKQKRFCSGSRSPDRPVQVPSHKGG